MFFRRFFLISVMLVLVSMLLAACGGSDGEPAAPASSVAAPQQRAETQAEPEPEPQTEASTDDSMAETASDTDTGGMEAMDANATTAAAAPAENPVTVGDDGIARLTIGSTDTMQYTVRAFTVDAGQQVELTLVHEGSLPIDVMGHNVVILPMGGDYVAFSRQVMSSGGSVDNQYLPEDMRDGLVAYPQLIGGGESDTITFTAPDAPGEYPFLCTFPGHFGVMNGIMTVL
jgi:azurin